MKGIYILTNKVNGMQYIGRSHAVSRRLIEHFEKTCPSTPLIYEAIQEFGKSNFIVELIDCTGYHDVVLCSFEYNLIKKLNTLTPNGYNATDGKITYREKRKISAHTYRRRPDIWKCQEEICNMYQNTSVSVADIASHFKSSKSTIYRVLRDKIVINRKN